MPEIAPFSAIRYNTQKLGKDLSAFLAPPYDVLDEQDQRQLLGKNSKNIVAVDLPHLPPKSLGPPEAYQRSAELLKVWHHDGTLVRDTLKSLYLYHQEFQHEGRTYTRRMFFAVARLTPFSEGKILPHERTFGGPKEDRMALMRATQCHLSPVFGLFSDSQGQVDRAFSQVQSQNADAVGVLEGVTNKIWSTSEPKVIESVTAALRDKKVYIADGHHRYETALRYRDALLAERGGLAMDAAANFVLLVLASMEDPGCLILPYHRVALHVNIPTLLRAWATGARQVETESYDLSLSDGRDGQLVRLQFTDRAKLRTLEPDQPKAWHQLDTAYLHRYLIDELLAAELRASGESPKLEYVKSKEDALKTAREREGVALLLNPTPMAHLREVSEAGGLMPQKSTYFYPKLATGLVINPLY